MRNVASKKTCLPLHHRHFFRIIPPHDIRSNTSIPKSFFKYLKAKKHQTVLLRRGRRKWPVEIDSDGVFRRGWSKFVTDNGVQPFDFILFEHEGNMVFDFMVFDQSTCEREYSNLQENSLSKSNIPIHFHEKSKKNRKGSSVGSDGRCFTSTLTPYYVNNSILNVPMKFARSNGLITNNGSRREIILRDEKQRSWPAALRMKKSSIVLCGFHHFKVANNLKVGDVCMFELIQPGQTVVLKFNCIGNKTIKNPVEQKGSSRTTFVNHNYFVSTVKPSNLKNSVLYLPNSFSKPNHLKTGKIFVIDEKKRPWELDLKDRGNSYLYVTGGFGAFLVANELKEGDAFKLEIIENKKNNPPIVKFSCLENKPNESHKRAKIKRSNLKGKPIEACVVSKSTPANFTLKEEEDIYSDS